MLIYYRDPANLNEVKEFCRKRTWRCTTDIEIVGSEASVTILYNLDIFVYEGFTRAKTQLVIVTIDGIEEKYFL